jgi:hypothetical protein
MDGWRKPDGIRQWKHLWRFVYACDTPLPPHFHPGRCSLTRARLHESRVSLSPWLWSDRRSRGSGDTADDAEKPETVQMCERRKTLRQAHESVIERVDGETVDAFVVSNSAAHALGCTRGVKPTEARSVTEDGRVGRTGRCVTVVAINNWTTHSGR